MHPHRRRKTLILPRRGPKGGEKSLHDGPDQPQGVFPREGKVEKGEGEAAVNKEAKHHGRTVQPNILD